MSNYDLIAHNTVSSSHKVSETNRNTAFQNGASETTFQLVDIPKRLISIKVHYITQFGEELMLVGSDPSLGCWDVERGVKMTWSLGHFWEAIIDCDALSEGFIHPITLQPPQRDQSFSLSKLEPMITKYNTHVNLLSSATATQQQPSDLNMMKCLTQEGILSAPPSPPHQDTLFSPIIRQKIIANYEQSPHQLVNSSLNCSSTATGTSSISRQNNLPRVLEFKFVLVREFVSTAIEFHRSPVVAIGAIGNTSYCAAVPLLQPTAPPCVYLPPTPSAVSLSVSALGCPSSATWFSSHHDSEVVSARTSRIVIRWEEGDNHRLCIIPPSAANPNASCTPPAYFTLPWGFGSINPFRPTTRVTYRAFSLPPFAAPPFPPSAPPKITFPSAPSKDWEESLWRLQAAHATVLAQTFNRARLLPVNPHVASRLFVATVLQLDRTDAQRHPPPSSLLDAPLPLQQLTLLPDLACGDTSLMRAALNALTSAVRAHSRHLTLRFWESSRGVLCTDEIQLDCMFMLFRIAECIARLALAHLPSDLRGSIDSLPSIDNFVLPANSSACTIPFKTVAALATQRVQDPQLATAILNILSSGSTNFSETSSSSDQHALHGGGSYTPTPSTDAAVSLPFGPFHLVLPLIASSDSDEKEEKEMIKNRLSEAIEELSFVSVPLLLTQKSHPAPPPLSPLLTAAVPANPHSTHQKQKNVNQLLTLLNSLLSSPLLSSPVAVSPSKQTLLVSLPPLVHANAPRMSPSSLIGLFDTARALLAACVPSPMQLSMDSHAHFQEIDSLLSPIERIIFSHSSSCSSSQREGDGTQQNNSHVSLSVAPIRLDASHAVVRVFSNLSLMKKLLGLNENCSSSISQKNQLANETELKRIVSYLSALPPINLPSLHANKSDNPCASDFRLLTPFIVDVSLFLAPSPPLHRALPGRNSKGHQQNEGQVAVRNTPVIQYLPSNLVLPPADFVSQSSLASSVPHSQVSLQFPQGLTPRLAANNHLALAQQFNINGVTEEDAVKTGNEEIQRHENDGMQRKISLNHHHHHLNNMNAAIGSNHNNLTIANLLNFHNRDKNFKLLDQSINHVSLNDSNVLLPTLNIQDHLHLIVQQSDNQGDLATNCMNKTNCINEEVSSKTKGMTISLDIDGHLSCCCNLQRQQQQHTLCYPIKEKSSERRASLCNTDSEALAAAVIIFNRCQTNKNNPYEFDYAAEKKHTSNTIDHNTIFEKNENNSKEYIETQFFDKNISNDIHHNNISTFEISNLTDGRNIHKTNGNNTTFIEKNINQQNSSATFSTDKNETSIKSFTSQRYLQYKIDKYDNEIDLCSKNIENCFYFPLKHTPWTKVITRPICDGEAELVTDGFAMNHAAAALKCSIRSSASCTQGSLPSSPFLPQSHRPSPSSHPTVSNFSANSPDFAANDLLAALQYKARMIASSLPDCQSDPFIDLLESLHDPLSLLAIPSSPVVSPAAIPIQFPGGINDEIATPSPKVSYSARGVSHLPPSPPQTSTSTTSNKASLGSKIYLMKDLDQDDKVLSDSHMSLSLSERKERDENLMTCKTNLLSPPPNSPSVGLLPIHETSGARRKPSISSLLRSSSEPCLPTVHRTASLLPGQVITKSNELLKRESNFIPINCSSSISSSVGNFLGPRHSQSLGALPEPIEDDGDRVALHGEDHQYSSIKTIVTKETPKHQSQNSNLRSILHQYLSDFIGGRSNSLESIPPNNKKENDQKSSHLSQNNREKNTPPIRLTTQLERLKHFANCGVNHMSQSPSLQDTNYGCHGNAFDILSSPSVASTGCTVCQSKIACESADDHAHSEDHVKALLALMMLLQ